LVEIIHKLPFFQICVELTWCFGLTELQNIYSFDCRSWGSGALIVFGVELVRVVSLVKHPVKSRVSLMEGG